METLTSVRGKLFTSVWTVLLPIWQPSLHSRMSGSANQLAWHCCLLSISVFSIRGPNTNVDLLPMFMPLNGGFLTWGHPKSSQIRPWPWLSIETHGGLGTSKTILRNLEIFQWAFLTFSKGPQKGARLRLVRADAQQQFLGAVAMRMKLWLSQSWWYSDSTYSTFRFGKCAKDMIWVIHAKLQNV